MGSTEWCGETAMRISVTNWRTTPDDVERAVKSILAVADQLARRGGSDGSYVNPCERE
jgi:hypothetical protein